MGAGVRDRRGNLRHEKWTPGQFYLAIEIPILNEQLGALDHRLLPEPNEF